MRVSRRLEADATVVQEARDEMDCRTVEGSFGQNFDTSIPCQLRFTESPEQDTDRFHDALAENGYSKLDPNPDRRRTDESPHYNGEIASKEHHHRLKVMVFRGSVVRLFPHDKHVPSCEELAALLRAIETGFSAELEHDPIDRETNA